LSQWKAFFDAQESFERMPVSEVNGQRLVSRQDVARGGVHKAGGRRGRDSADNGLFGVVPGRHFSFLKIRAKADLFCPVFFSKKSARFI
jgi:hypothetical protein